MRGKYHRAKDSVRHTPYPSSDTCFCSQTFFFFFRSLSQALKLLDLFGVYQFSLFDKTDELGNLLPEPVVSTTDAAAAAAATTTATAPAAAPAAGAESDGFAPPARAAAPAAAPAPAAAAAPAPAPAEAVHTDHKDEVKKEGESEEDHKHAEDAKLAEERRQYLRKHPEEDPHNMYVCVG